MGGGTCWWLLGFVAWLLFDDEVCIGLGILDGTDADGTELLLAPAPAGTPCGGYGAIDGGVW